MGICYIAGAGEHFGEKISPGPEDRLIAADGGYAWITELGLVPDLIVGDFDSLPFVPEGKNILKLKKEKDETDIFVCVEKGLEMGFRTFYLFGGTGGRISHTLANVDVLAWLSGRGCRGVLFGKDYLVTSVTNGSISFPEGWKGYISVFSHDAEAAGVTLEGLKYPLRNATVSNTFPIGVSNEFTGQKCTISVEKGTLIVVCEPEEAGELWKELQL